MGEKTHVKHICCDHSHAIDSLLKYQHMVDLLKAGSTPGGCTFASLAELELYSPDKTNHLLRVRVEKVPTSYALRTETHSLGVINRVKKPPSEAVLE